MAVLSGKKKVSAPFLNEATLMRIPFSFANDGGAIADYDVIEADGPLLIELINIDMEIAATSAGSMVMDLGKGAAGVEFKSDLAVASMTLDAQIAADTVGKVVELAHGEKIVLGLEAAAATAGKFSMMFKIYARS